MNWVRHGGSTTFETKSSYCRALAVLHGSSTTWFQTSHYCRAKVEFNSINWVRHGSSTTFEMGLIVTRFLAENNIVRFLVHFFFSAACFHPALVVDSISHFVTAATKFSCCSSSKEMSPLFFISRSRSPSPFFSLSFAGLPPTSTFSLSLRCSIFQICEPDNYCTQHGCRNNFRFPFSSLLTL